jgi:ubiquinol-cytochrome c reductase cytochrome c1 subunit
MKELKALLIIVFFTLVTYWGVEPFAHSKMHAHVEPADFEFKDLDAMTSDIKGGSVEAGAELVQSNCTACHGIKSQGLEAPMDAVDAAAAYGVVPPDLSTSGILYDDKYLAAFIKNPTKAALVEHKFPEGGSKMHPMPSYDWMSGAEIDSIVKYLKSIAPAKLTNKEVFVDACQRCHGLKYADMAKRTMGAKTPLANISTYMGSTPPDLSQYIRSRGEHYINTFVNNPQKLLHGTAMPRVGLSEKSQEQLLEYLIEVGDSSKPKREALGINVIIFFIVFAFVAYLWKNKIWSRVH